MSADDRAKTQAESDVAALAKLLTAEASQRIVGEILPRLAKAIDAGEGGAWAEKLIAIALSSSHSYRAEEAVAVALAEAVRTKLQTEEFRARLAEVAGQIAERVASVAAREMAVRIATTEWAPVRR